MARQNFYEEVRKMVWIIPPWSDLTNGAGESDIAGPTASAHGRTLNNQADLEEE